MTGLYLKKVGLISLLLCVCFPAYAQPKDTPSEKDTPLRVKSYELPKLEHTYSEKFCGFEIKFPNEPTITDITSPDTPDLQATSISFLKIYDIDKSVRVTANCKQINKDIRIFINETSIEQELEAIIQDKNIKLTAKSSTARPKERLRIGSLSGQRSTTPNQGIYIYQLWVTDTSIFTLEAEVTGPEYPDADKLLVSILQSFHRTPATETTAP